MKLSNSFIVGVFTFMTVFDTIMFLLAASAGDSDGAWTFLGFAIFFALVVLNLELAKKEEKE